MDPVAVVVESDFVNQRRADDVSRMDDGAVRRISKNVSNCGYVVAAPLRGAISLADLLRNPVSEN